MTQVAAHLPSKRETLNPTSSATKNKQTNKKQVQRHERAVK
jgi:hypothetical protein